MINPKTLDIIELLFDLPEHSLHAGGHGAIVHQHTDDVFEVEFADEDGEALALCALSMRQFIVVWRAETQQWVPVSERVAQIVARLPEETGIEVLDFARFLGMRAQQPHLAKAQPAIT